MRRISVTCLLLALGASACAVPFSDANFAPYRGDGPAMLEGQAYMQFLPATPRAITCVGQPVFLAPATAFDLYVIRTASVRHPAGPSSIWLGQAFDVIDTAEVRQPVVNEAGPAAPYWRKSTCDSQGRFTFLNVPAGDWLVVTQMSWKPIPGQHDYGEETLVKKVALRPGQNVVIMSSVVGHY